MSNTVAAQTYGEDTVLVPETVAADSLPDVGTPIFWFDCSDRTGWTIDPETKAVTSIPSKTGDGRTIASGSFYQRSGGQLMGELLIYSNALTSAQIEGLEAYLKRKWGFVRPQATNLAEVAVAEGAALDLQGSSQYLAAISGGGVVSNGVLTAGAVDSSEGLDVDGDLSLADGAVWSIAVGADGCETLSVDGTLTFGPNLTIALNGLEGRRDLREKTFTLASAGTLVGAENVLSATVATPGLPPSINAVVSVDGNAVKVRFKALGLSVIFR